MTTLDVSFDESFAGGIRGGYWLPLQLGPVNFGVGLDLSHFRPDIGRKRRTVCSSFCVSGVFDDVDLSVRTVGIDAMFRFPPLKSTTFPHGQLQPYITVGPAIFVAHAEDSTTSCRDHRSQHEGEHVLRARRGLVPLLNLAAPPGGC